MYVSLTLLREMVPSLTLLADMTAQAKAVEIMISHVHDVRKLFRLTYTDILPYSALCVQLLIIRLKLKFSVCRFTTQLITYSVAAH